MLKEKLIALFTLFISTTKNAYLEKNCPSSKTYLLDCKYIPFI